MLMHVLDSAASLSPEKIHVVTGFRSEEIQNSVAHYAPDYLSTIAWVHQEKQLGTGHAVMQAMPAVNPNAHCLILYGDVPLVDRQVLSAIAKLDASLVLLTSKPEDCEGMGRILRDEENRVTGIIEQKDASDAQKQIEEINTGIMMCKGRDLSNWLNHLGNNNSQGEYYLTDVVEMAVFDQKPVEAVVAADSARFAGVNSKLDLATAERTYQKSQAVELMNGGVTLLDPDRIDIRGNASFGQDCCVDVNVILEGEVSIGSGVVIEPNCIIRNSQIGDYTRILANTLIEDAVVGQRCQIGPFARLRPDTKLLDEVRIGNFVEIKNSEFGNSSKANHLAYVGDSSVGSNVNIGAGVITCNYDGANKHKTTIGDDVFVGSDSQLVAPVTIESGATIGAGATITKNVQKNDLAISRAKQVAIKNWERPKKK